MNRQGQQNKLDFTKNTAAVVLFGILLNDLGKAFAEHFALPVWLDSFGTVFAAYVLGPVCGAIVGAAGNLAYSIWHASSPPIYAVTSLFIGFSVGIAAQKGYLATLFHAMSVAAMVTFGSGVVSAAINLIFYAGSTGNIWGDGVKDFLIEKGVPYVLSAVIGEFYLDFLDKLVTVLAFYCCIRLRRKVRKHAALFLCAVLSVLLVCARTVPVAYAKEPTLPVSYTQTVYDRENGLPCGHANAVAQTDDGILWIGSDAGLYRYNGSTFRFMAEYDVVKNVNCLFVDEEGRLWIGTKDNGVVIVINEKVANVVDSKKGLPSDTVRCITQNEEGEYYIGTSAGVAVLGLKTGIAVSKVLHETQDTTAICADRSGNVIAVNAAGQVYLLQDRAIVNTLSTNGSSERFTCCSFDEAGLLYLGTSGESICVYRLNDRSFRRERLLMCTGLSKINAIAAGKENGLCICADNGIGFWKDERTFIRYEAGDFQTAIMAMEVDYQGNLWFASSKKGLMRLSRSAFTQVFHTAQNAAGEVCTTALWNGCLYVGTKDGLFVVDMERGRAVTNALTKLLEHTPVYCIRTDLSGALWLCTKEKGLVCMDRERTITTFDAQKTPVGDCVRVCEPLSDGTLAVGSENGLHFIKDNRVLKTIAYGEELGTAPVLCFWEQSDGTLFAGTDGNGIIGLEKTPDWSDAQVKKWIGRDDGLASKTVLRIVPDFGENSAFLVTRSALCHMENGKVRTLGQYPYSNSFDLIANQDGEVFVLGSAGIYVMKREALLSDEPFEYQVLDAGTGLHGALTAGAWNAVDEDNNLYLSTDLGVFCMNLDAYRMERGSYRLMVSRIELDGVSVAIERGTTLTIARDVKKIVLTPEIVNYTLENPTVSYYLEGAESTKHTVTQGAPPQAVYTNLPAGSYVFHLAILDDDGAVLEESTYRFVKEKSIYDNAWFMAYMVVVAGIFIGWITWFVTRTRIQRTLELQQVKLQLALQQVQMGNETILAIAKTVDAKDGRTSKHSQRVSEYAVLLAQAYGFCTQEQENLRKAALLHDIGKIAIPDAILNKPTRLTDEEYAVMKTHVTRGAEILKEFTLVEHVVEGARYHHERYDGRGYPEGLCGEDIPLYGRMIAVADAFDAMTANRVYREKQDFAYVLTELHKGRGTQFDPVLLDLFLTLLEGGTIDIGAIYANQEQGDNKDA